MVVRKLTVTVFAGLGEVLTEAGEKSHVTPVGAPEQLKVTTVGNELVTVNVAALLGLPWVALTGFGDGTLGKSMLPTSSCTAWEWVVLAVSAPTPRILKLNCPALALLAVTLLVTPPGVGIAVKPLQVAGKVAPWQVTVTLLLYPFRAVSVTG